MKSFSRIIFGLFLFGLTAQVAWVQGQTTASVFGTVSDATGARTARCRGGRDQPGHRLTRALGAMMPGIPGFQTWPWGTMKSRPSWWDSRFPFAPESH